MKRYCFSGFLIFIILGCSSMQYHDEHYASRFSQYGYGYKPNSLENTEIKETSSSYKLLKKYADRIAFELASQVDISTISGVSVTSYVDLDDNLNNTHAFGNKLAEILIISLHQAGFKLLEPNLNTHIKTTEYGSFIFKRQSHSISANTFVVSGIINYSKSGININSRLMKMSNANILAANSLSMPYFVMKSAFPTVAGNDLIIKGQ
ncbi:FlgO family outer membrane protein [Pseudoalteromonas denitrificans]|uniref:FlgO domain-containing protein n=1 Tax=Pseudoalteromonas denitrificans DSM 6059 TaxID=1123010 RepID=A0A1I1HU86_9GAMM|nr:FlgO family outer membrane protein [Pseudoalteromonas denitrificans]SFC25508.1 hypothetical protein SAMN02745724_01277 [Pseudoalteromonas denitrificans DSM 6059]